tara:strand:- start:289 stop:444 length:156 start_codon:yes stop_codon:yes gene_type:complete
MKSKTYKNILKDATTKYDNTINTLSATMTEEQYFSRLTAHYERFEDYDDEE